MADPPAFFRRLTSASTTAAIAGVVAGVLGYALDLSLAAATMGYWLPVTPSAVGAYALWGGAVGLLSSVGARAFVRMAARRAPTERHAEQLPPVFHTAVAFSSIQLPGVAERIEDFAASQRVGVPGGWLVALVLLGGAAALALAALVGGARARAPGNLAVAGVAIATGLAVNRNVVDRALEPAALAADLAVVVFAAILVLYRHRPRWLLVAVATVLGVAPIVYWQWLAPSASRQSGAEDGPPPRPHVVLAVIDTLRADVFESVLEETEEGAALAAILDGSIWFTRAIAAAPYTPPSVGTILTGLYPPQHGLGLGRRGARRLRSGVSTLAEILDGAGYRTVGLVANPILLRRSLASRGFDHYELLADDRTRLPFLHALDRAMFEPTVGYQPADRVTRRAVRVLDDHPAAEPLFLWVHLMDPHTPLHRHRRLAPDPGESGLPEEDRLYRRETRFAVGQLDEVLRVVDRRLGLENTLVVVVADHGEMLLSDDHAAEDGRGNVMRRGHGHAYYEELVRVPLGLRLPGPVGERGSKRSDLLVHHVDLLPTILDVVGVEAPPPVDGGFSREGCVLTAWLEGPAPEESTACRELALVSNNHWGPPHLAVRTLNGKLIYDPESERPTELYDLVADPREQNDLAAEQPDVVAALASILTTMWARIGADGPTEEIELDPETRRQLEALGYL